VTLGNSGPVLLDLMDEDQLLLSRLARMRRLCSRRWVRVMGSMLMSGRRLGVVARG
jgi:hypothetical protein